MMSEQNERLHILDMIDDGIITAEEGYRLLQALEDQPGEVVALTQDEETFHRPEPPTPEQVARWKRWWMIPLWVGVGITVLGAGLMYWSWQSTGFSFWFACTWMPFLIGVCVLALGWASQKSPWLHLRVEQAPGEKPERITISVPLPLRLTIWFLETFGRMIPKLDATQVDEIITALGSISPQDEPFYITVDEGDDGERVQVFIG